MRIALCSILAAALVSTAWAQDAGKFKEGGISFDYPKDWKLKTEKPGGIVSATAQNAKGTQVVVQAHSPGTDAKGIARVMGDTFKKAFEGKMVPNSEKAVKRKFASGEQEGTEMAFEVAKGVAIQMEIFAFPLGKDKPVVCAIFQHAAFDAEEAKKAFEQVAGTLSAGGGMTAKTPVPVIPKEKEVPVASPVSLPAPAPGGWGFKAAKAGTKLWADRDYAFTKLPKDLEGGAVFQRGAEEGKAWIPSGKLVITKDCTAYAIVRTKYMGMAQLDAAAFANLKSEGWNEVADAVETTFPGGENWEWKMVKKPFKRAEELGVLKSMSWTQPIIFVFK